MPNCSKTDNIIIKPRIRDGCISFDIVCVSVCVFVCLLPLSCLNGQSYRPEFSYVGQVEEYLGQVKRSMSKVKGQGH